MDNVNMNFTMELKERWLKPMRSLESMIVLKVEVKPICTLLLYFSLIISWFQ